MRKSRVPNGFIALLVILQSSFLAAFAEQLPVQQLHFRRWPGSSFVNALMRDSRGFLWVCTRDGLSRFDGYRFVTYQVGDKNAPPGIEQILETRKGHLLDRNHQRVISFRSQCASSLQTKY